MFETTTKDITDVEVGQGIGSFQETLEELTGVVAGLNQVQEIY